MCVCVSCCQTVLSWIRRSSRGCIRRVRDSNRQDSSSLVLITSDSHCSGSGRVGGHNVEREQKNSVTFLWMRIKVFPVDIPLCSFPRVPLTPAPQSLSLDFGAGTIFSSPGSHDNLDSQRSSDLMDSHVINTNWGVRHGACLRGSYTFTHTHLQYIYIIFLSFSVFQTHTQPLAVRAASPPLWPLCPPRPRVVRPQTPPAPVAPSAPWRSGWPIRCVSSALGRPEQARGSGRSADWRANPRLHPPGAAKNSAIRKQQKRNSPFCQL